MAAQAVLKPCVPISRRACLLQAFIARTHPAVHVTPVPHLLVSIVLCSTLPCSALQSPKEQRERLACEARMQQLPEGVQGVPVVPRWATEGL